MAWWYGSWSLCAEFVLPPFRRGVPSYSPLPLLRLRPFPTMAVESVLIINNYGKPRLATFYHSIPPAQQQLLIRTIFRLVSSRPDGDVCNFLDAPELDPLLQTGRPSDAAKSKSRSRGDKGDGSSSITGGQERRVIYRHYATLWFVFVVDQSESELGILDLIQVSELSGARRRCPAAADDSCCATPGLRRISRPFLSQRLRAGSYIPLRGGQCDLSGSHTGWAGPRDEYQRDSQAR